MKDAIEYTDAPEDITESLERGVIVPNFPITPQGVAEFAARRTKKQISIYLSVETIEKFKGAAQKDGNRYQTMISNVLDTYAVQL
ncbi:MAG: BrnA antitoxin family protein [Defluviitaleaceae bacterium]|nr:BrnA antitoxin family protein [Defluviitaleaceae bacterium]MCL2262721.1 BrnA antitoxin family protein [Defluviitaleaceae bacterium]